MRWLSPENLHVTVQFLGEVEDTALPELTSALERACARQTPFELAVERVGPAPPGRRARMIWAHLGRSDGYEGLCASVAAAAAPFAPRLALPAHPRAHVTLARFARPGPSRAALDLSPCGDFAVVPVSACRLVRSRLSSAGAAYTTLAGLPLDGGAGVTPPAPA